MQSQLVWWSKVHCTLFLGFLNFIPSQLQRMVWPTTRVAHTCIVAHSLTAKNSHSILQLTTISCLLVQGYGADHLRAWVVARSRITCSVPRVQVSSWSHQLLLLAHLVSTAWFHCSKVTACRISWVTWPHLRLLSKVPLCAQFHWAILGCSKNPLPWGPKSKDSSWNGEHCQEQPRQSPHDSYLKVLLPFSFIFSYLTLSQVRKLSCTFCCCVQEQIVRCTSCMGKQKIPWALHLTTAGHPQS